MKRQAWTEFREHFERILPGLSKHNLGFVMKAVRQQRKVRYCRRQAARYGNLSRAFTVAEVARFFGEVRNRKAFTILWLMASLGLRVGEACSLRKDHVNLAQRQVWIDSEKDSVPSMMALHDRAYPVLAAWMAAHQEAIDRTGYVFPAEERHNKTPYASTAWLRNQFSIARKRAGLDFTYGVAVETYRGRKARMLYRLTTHSLRHHFGHFVFDKTLDILVTQKLMRHKKLENTLIYTRRSQEEANNALSKAFEATP